jgi:hypothetical protein
MMRPGQGLRPGRRRHGSALTQGGTGLGGGGCPHDVPGLLCHLAGGPRGVVRQVEEVAKVGPED